MACKIGGERLHADFLTMKFLIGQKIQGRSNELFHMTHFFISTFCYSIFIANFKTSRGNFAEIVSCREKELVKMFSLFPLK